MGMLDTDLSADGGEAASGEAAAEAEQEGQQQAAETPQAQPERKEHVPIGRRAQAARAREELSTKVKELETNYTKQSESHRAELARRDAELAELRGRMQALQPIIERGAAPQQQQAGPTPEELGRQARAALDKGDFTEYERLKDAQADAKFEAKLAAFRQSQPQQQQQQQLHPALQALRAQNWRIETHPAGQMTVVQKDALLAAAGEPAGPARWEKAFKMADAELFGNEKTTPQFDKGASGGVAGVPTGRNGGSRAGEREPGVELSDHERMIAAKAGMKDAEYAQYLAQAFPERVVR